MLFYHSGAIIKIFVGIGISYLLYNYVNIYQDPLIGLSFGFIGVFFVIWGISFYIFFIGQKIFSRKDNIYLASKSYKLSLLFGLFLIINLAFLILEERTKLIGLGLFLVFLFLHILTIFENE